MLACLAAPLKKGAWLFEAAGLAAAYCASGAFGCLSPEEIIEEVGGQAESALGQEQSIVRAAWHRLTVLEEVVVGLHQRGTLWRTGPQHYGCWPLRA